MVLTAEDRRNARWVMVSPNMPSIPFGKIGSCVLHAYDNGTRVSMTVLVVQRNTRTFLLLTLASQCHERLAWGMTFKDSIATVADWQRTYLNIYGWLNNVRIYQPRFLNVQAQNHTADTHVIEAFTHDFRIAQQLIRMGIMCTWRRARSWSQLASM